MTGGYKDASISVEDKLKEYLVEQGTVGCAHEQIRRQFRFLIDAADLQILLNMLWEDRKIDRYLINSGRGRPATWYRATTRMLEDD
jgi:hypothetical protein